MELLYLVFAGVGLVFEVQERLVAGMLDDASEVDAELRAVAIGETKVLLCRQRGVGSAYLTVDEGYA